MSKKFLIIVSGCGKDAAFNSFIITDKKEVIDLMLIARECSNMYGEKVLDEKASSKLYNSIINGETFRSNYYKDLVDRIEASNKEEVKKAVLNCTDKTKTIAEIENSVVLIKVPSIEEYAKEHSLVYNYYSKGYNAYLKACELLDSDDVFKLNYEAGDDIKESFNAEISKIITLGFLDQ